VHALLLGDAAHIHTCQRAGMNTGIGDAINLAWNSKPYSGGAHPVRGATPVRTSVSFRAASG
jgi:2-polyprenyl-6-methoxyphenol hydroxylase-like FAD-dependent oxidoreductase